MMERHDVIVPADRLIIFAAGLLQPCTRSLKQFCFAVANLSSVALSSQIKTRLTQCTTKHDLALKILIIKSPKTDIYLISNIQFMARGTITFHWIVPIQMKLLKMTLQKNVFAEIGCSLNFFGVPPFL